MTAKKLAKEIERHKKAIGIHRDALRDLVADAEEIINDSHDAVDALEQAIDVLSRNL
jgi:hypothetical protein